MGFGLGGIADVLKGMGKQVQPWDLVNPSDVVSKTTWKDDNAKGYYIYYEGKEISRLSFSDLRAIRAKPRDKAVIDLQYKFQTMHVHFKNKTVYETLAKKFADELKL